MMVKRAERNVADRSSWELDGHDFKIDHFIQNYYEHLVTRRDRSR